MNDLLEFLTSEEIIIVYIIAAFACLICYIVYLIEKNNESLRRRHNTKELNKLVEEIREQMPEDEETYYEEPIMETIDEKSETSLQELLNQEPMIIEPIDVEETQDLQDVVTQIKEIEKQEVEEQQDELEYEPMEPDQETAKQQLRELQVKLEQQEQREENIALTSFEEEQERTAIISMDELLKKSKEIYQENEQITATYQDEGNEPISLQDLERQVERQAAVYDEPFIIANVVPEEEINEVDVVEEQKEVLHMDDFHTITEETKNPVKVGTHKKFQSTPFISPIFGIEKTPEMRNEMSLENTANYDKLDEQIRKSNEFVMSLKELQEKLDS